MGKPLMIQDEDDAKIEELKRRTKAKTKIEIVRAGLKLLEKETDRAERIKRWERAARLASSTSLDINAAFQPHSRFKKG